MRIPRVPNKALIKDFIRSNYRISEVPTNKFITPAEISDDLFIQYAHRFYHAEVRNILREMGYEVQPLPNQVYGYYLSQN